MFKHHGKTWMFGIVATLISCLVIFLATLQPISAIEPVSIIPDTEFRTTEQVAVTSVAELKDIQPTDWAFQAIQSLAERWGMPLAYPDLLFRGNKAARRGELAQWFQGFISQANQLVNVTSAGNTQSDLATPEDLAQLRQSLESLRQSIRELKEEKRSNPPVI
ncbi:MAG: S-layer protein [Limnospira sp.]